MSRTVRDLQAKPSNKSPFEWQNHKLRCYQGTFHPMSSQIKQNKAYIEIKKKGGTQIVYLFRHFMPTPVRNFATTTSLH